MKAWELDVDSSGVMKECRLVVDSSVISWWNMDCCCCCFQCFHIMQFGLFFIPVLFLEGIWACC